MSELRKIGMLWMKGPLSFLEQLCVKSFIDAGHEVWLYHYADIFNVPDGVVLKDANDILPQTGFLVHERTGSPALHSDLFRYHMLNKVENIIWADTDAYCCKPFVTETGHFFGWESIHHINGGVLGLPQDSKALELLLEFTSDEFAIPPWFNKDRKTELQRLKDLGKPVHAGEMPWGVWGPHAVTYFLHATRENIYAFQPVGLYPVAFKNRNNLLKRNYDFTGIITEETYSIHLYGRRMRRRIQEKEEGAIPRRWSMLGKLLKLHGIDPLLAPIPPKLEVQDSEGAAVEFDEENDN